MDKRLRQLYVDVMNCNYSENDCPLAQKLHASGLVPRAFNPCSSRITQILAVGKNPGNPLPGEQSYYKDKKGEDLLAAKEEWDLEKYWRIVNTKDRSLIFHRNLRRYLRYFLGITDELETYARYRYSPDHEKDIFKYVAFTNLFKCSSEDERVRIKDESFDVCFKKYFTREVELIRPKVVLALGGEVARFLCRQLDVPVVKIKHPSYFYRTEIERDELRKKKKELDGHLHL